jgi:hypothetical protein
MKTLATAPVVAQRLHAEIDNLPEESLLELEKFLEFLHFKTMNTSKQTQPFPPLTIIKLRGILKGSDFSPKLLAEARQEMWRKFQDQPA